MCIASYQYSDDVRERFNINEIPVYKFRLFILCVVVFISGLLMENCRYFDRDNRPTFKDLVQILEKIIEVNSSSEVTW